MRWVRRHIGLTSLFQRNSHAAIVEYDDCGMQRKFQTQPFAITCVLITETDNNEEINFRHNTVSCIYRHCQLSRGLRQ